MDQLQHSPARGRSPSVTDPSIKPSHSPSPSPAPSFNPSNHAAVNNNSSIVLDLPLDPTSQTFHSASASPAFSTIADFNATHQSFADQLKATSADAVFAQGFINPQQAFGGEDFTIFPTQSVEQLAAPLFDPNQQQHQHSTPDGNGFTMAASQPPHSPTPPHLLPGSARQSPSFNNHQFVQPAGHHSRHVSLTPEAALTPDWNGLPFQGHRRHGSELSDASSIGGYSPSLAGQDAFSDPIDHVQNSPMLPADESTGDIYQELNGITNFSISNSYSSHQTPAHSPAISPRILPQSSAEAHPTNVPGFMLQPQTDGGFVQYDTQQYINTSGPGGEAFPQLPAATAAELSQHMAQMSAPTIEIDFAPNTATTRNMFDGKVIDTDALLPPEQRGRSRRRANTDPYSGGIVPGVVRTADGGGSASVQPSADLNPQREATRSLSPMLGSGSAMVGSRRRLSTSAVPSTMALRLAESDYGGAAETGPAGLGANGGLGGSGGGGGGGASGAGGGVSGAGTKRAQKHPANFQCTLCPKRFTRAYNLRSHLRTHTDERPFVCNFCGKAFARQHDRKRHEALHSGEKKFVCKGELKIGGEWGCGRRFARADALGRHFRSEAGRICIKPLLDEEFIDRQRAWQEQQQQQHMQAQQNMLMVQQQQQQQQQPIDPNTGYPMDAAGNYALPAALLAQYPALAQMNWAAVDMAGGAGGGGMDDDLSGRSSFDASDYDDGDDGGYVSGPGTGFGEGGMSENFGESMGGYSSDLGQ